MLFRAAHTRCSSPAQRMAASPQQHTHTPCCKRGQLSSVKHPLPWRAWAADLKSAVARNCARTSSAASMPSSSEHNASNLLAEANMFKQRAGRTTTASHRCQPIAASCHRQFVHVCLPPTIARPLLQSALGRLCTAARHLPHRSSS